MLFSSFTELSCSFLSFPIFCFRFAASLLPWLRFSLVRPKLGSAGLSFSRNIFFCSWAFVVYPAVYLVSALSADLQSQSPRLVGVFLFQFFRLLLSVCVLTFNWSVVNVVKFIVKLKQDFQKKIIMAMTFAIFSCDKCSYIAKSKSTLNFHKG